jgi:hypothetical protein
MEGLDEKQNFILRLSKANKYIYIYKSLYPKKFTENPLLMHMQVKMAE